MTQTQLPHQSRHDRINKRKISSLNPKARTLYTEIKKHTEENPVSEEELKERGILSMDEWMSFKAIIWNLKYQKLIGENNHGFFAV